MLDKTHSPKRMRLPVCGNFLFLVSLSALVMAFMSLALHVRSGIAQADFKFDPFKYLPVGAKIKNREKDVTFADLDGDGQQEAIVFYTFPNNPNDQRANILVLKPNGRDYAQMWEDVSDFSWGFADPTGVYDLNKSGRPQIVAYRIIGASCPGILDIYQYRNGKIERITGAWADNGQCQSVVIKDLNGDGVSEIIVRIRNYGINPDIYRWNGKRYVRSNSLFPHYYNEELKRLLQSVRSRESMPISARVMWSKQIVDIYIIQKRYSEAIQFCEDVLRIIDDPNSATPNSIIRGEMTPEQQSPSVAVLEIEKANGKAEVHHLMGDVYKAAGDLQRAEKEYQRARRLEAEAKQRASKLPR
ncbi:MAG TPA: hypothetical protein IGS52_03080 [Oscillatoriaceae cyanobacterium M33_DOE_052]|nr:hypothetical protein [Oscillatoriaceae cyanobacterium M33_DOE_052]